MYNPPAITHHIRQHCGMWPFWLKHFLHSHVTVALKYLYSVAMGKRLPQPMRDVKVTMLEDNRALIEGGHLNTSHGWCTDVTRSRDKKTIHCAKHNVGTVGTTRREAPQAERVDGVPHASPQQSVR